MRRRNQKRVLMRSEIRKRERSARKEDRTLSDSDVCSVIIKFQLMRQRFGKKNSKKGNLVNLEKMENLYIF